MKYRNLFERPCYSDNIYTELRIKGLSIFYQKAKSELHDFRRLFKMRNYKDEILATTAPLNDNEPKSDIRIHFEEMCYVSKLKNSEVKKYLHFLKRRIRDVEMVIDSHFELIKKPIRQSKIDKFERKIRKDQEEEEKIERERKEMKKLLSSPSDASHRSRSVNSGLNRSHRSVNANPNQSTDDISSTIQTQLKQEYKDKVMK